MSNAWNEGYFTDEGYTYSYSREINPVFQRYCLLLRGFAGLDNSDGYHCELGFGQGVSINIHATANPGGWPVGGLTVIAFRNHHLVYAVTWFALAAMLAGVGCGLFKDLEEASVMRGAVEMFEPGMAAEVRDRRLTGWNKAVRSVIAKK